MVTAPRKHSYGIILGVWVVVTVYALIHDQYLVNIAPEHFTEYHPPLWGIENPKLLAAALAFQAAIVPSLILGVACIFALNFRKRGRRASVKYVALGVVVVCVLTECCCLLVWLYVHLTSKPLFPVSLYPDLSKPILITQSIQLTCYLCATLFSIVLIIHLICRKAE